MTLRDWFAGQALIGIITCVHARDLGFSSVADVIAGHAYQLADSMLAEKAKAATTP